jgi:hypothetical protein
LHAVKIGSVPSRVRKKRVGEALRDLILDRRLAHGEASDDEFVFGSGGRPFDSRGPLSPR